MERVIERIPSWALNYIINGESQGLTDDEKVLVHTFYESYNKNGYKIQIVSPHDECYFSKYPAFGLPCEVVDCDVLYSPKR